MKPQNFPYSDMNDIVFDQRNKSYGAFVLRKRYEKNVLKAVVIAVSIFALAIAMPGIVKAIKGPEKIEEAPVKIISISDLAPPPPIEETPPPPPPEFKLPPPPKQTIKFVAPKVTDKEVPEELEMPTMEEIKKAPVISTKTIEAPGNIVFEEPPEEIGEVGEPEPKVFTIVEQMPEFPGGEKALFEFLGDNIRYPASAQRMGIEGTVYVSFVIGPDGKISNIKVVKGLSEDLDAEAVRVIKEMPSWKPGKQRGRPVSVRFMLPFNFRLN